MQLSDLGPKEEHTSHFAVVRYSVAKIREYTADGKEAFLASTRAQDAVCFRFIAIWEAIDEVRGDMRWLTPLTESETDTIRKKRNVYAHEPNALSAEELWNTIETLLPAIEEASKNFPGFAALRFIDTASTDAERHMAAETEAMVGEVADRISKSLAEIIRPMTEALAKFRF